MRTFVMDFLLQKNFYIFMTITLSIQQQNRPTNCHTWPIIQSETQAIAPIQNQAYEWELVTK